MVQVSPEITVIDLTIRGLSPGTYNVTVRAAGDISQGAASTGDVWEDTRGRLGAMEVGPTGTGSMLVDKAVAVWELIGRSVVVSRRQVEFAKNDPDTIVGVIARSAGLWENEKTVRVTLVEGPHAQGHAGFFLCANDMLLTQFVVGMLLFRENYLGRKEGKC